VNACKHLISALFWDISKLRVAIIYRRFGTKYRSHLQGSRSPRRPLKMGSIRCPETSVKNYHSTLCNIPEERRSHQGGGGSLKSRLQILCPDFSYSCLNPFFSYALSQLYTQSGLTHQGGTPLQAFGMRVFILLLLTYRWPYMPSVCFQFLCGCCVNCCCCYSSFL
jgi:hypothetical protein